MQRMPRILTLIRKWCTSYCAGWKCCSFESRHTIVGFWVSTFFAVFGIFVAWWIFQVQLSLQITATEIQNRQTLDAKRDKLREEARTAAEAFQLQHIEERTNR